MWLVDRIASLLADLAARTPVLIVIDDAQWADPVTRFALDTLPSRLAGSPVVWLIASRDVADTGRPGPTPSMAWSGIGWC